MKHKHVILNTPLVSVNWLNKNIDSDNLIVFDATIPKVTEFNTTENQLRIPNTRFFDLKQKFSDVSAPFPTTFPSAEQFSIQAQALGVNKDSAIVVYDTKGIYSSARVWWMFKAMGHNNVAVLDGGLPEWTLNNYELNPLTTYKGQHGNFIAKQDTSKMLYFDDMKALVNDDSKLIIDARSSNRFQCLVDEPRKNLRRGTIPNSINIPYTNLFNGNTLKPVSQLTFIFKDVLGHKTIIFSCGSGITACVLALGITLCGYRNSKVYDGSWTEWGSLVKN